MIYHVAMLYWEISSIFVIILAPCFAEVSDPPAINRLFNYKALLVHINEHKSLLFSVFRRECLAEKCGGHWGLLIENSLSKHYKKLSCEESAPCQAALT